MWLKDVTIGQARLPKRLWHLDLVEDPPKIKTMPRMGQSRWLLSVLDAVVTKSHATDLLLIRPHKVDIREA